MYIYTYTKNIHIIYKYVYMYIYIYIHTAPLSLSSGTPAACCQWPGVSLAARSGIVQRSAISAGWIQQLNRKLSTPKPGDQSACRSFSCVTKVHVLIAIRHMSVRTIRRTMVKDWVVKILMVKQQLRSANKACYIDCLRRTPKGELLEDFYSDSCCVGNLPESTFRSWFTLWDPKLISEPDVRVARCSSETPC